MRTPLRLTPGDLGRALARAGVPGPGCPLVVYGHVTDWTPAPAEPPHPDDLARSRALRGAPLRHRFLASRLLLRRTLGAVSGRDPGTVTLARTALGRPYAPDLPELDFSLSHTGPLMAVAVLRGGRVGVDVERTGRAMTTLEHRMCTPHERAALDARGLRGAARDRELLRLWTLKEAYVKALGTGLRHPLRRLGLDPADPAGHPAPPDAPHPPATASYALPGAWVSVVVFERHSSR
ncbi:4'-phosphopantetheinyl transferase family protein [Streptomyces sp. NPDC058855]|uniref:4'-phosphopantetheinyl transferase family protein n=1 Tax=Streptomyces sp. NPDC058855 TaxID=3346651 RepID=UPI00368BB772